MSVQIAQTRVALIVAAISPLTPGSSGSDLNPVIRTDCMCSVKCAEASRNNKQGSTIRLPDCLGQSSFGLGNHDLQKNCPTGQVEFISKLTLNLLHKLQISKIMS